MRGARHIALLFLLSSCGGDDGTPAQIIDAGVTADAARPTRLSQTSLYQDFGAGTIAADMMPFAPRYILWSDGAEKPRWIRLPPGKKIDTSDMDHWQFPVGTQFFKEFRSNGLQVETRLIERTGEGSMDYWMGSFVWTDDGKDAVFQVDGAQDIRGTDHDAPAALRCWACHGGEPGHGLGFSAVQLSAAALAELVSKNLVTVPPSGEFHVPGDDKAARALGYLHANCGHCHNENGIARPDTDQILRLNLADTALTGTTTYRTTVGVPTQYFRDPAHLLRVAAGDPDASALLFRMSVRGDQRQMPPLATEHTDPNGLEIVRDWIASLPKN